jgi:LPS-assembly lipoprotein
MSSSDRHARLTVRFRALLASGALFTLAGCMPLYGTLGAGGLESELQAIEIVPIAGRTGHYVADDLMFAFNGSRAPVPPRYKLTVGLKEHVQTALNDTVTYRSTAATVITDAEFTLTPYGGGPVIIKGVAFGAVSYDRFGQRISNVAAARDAQVRDAHTIAESIKEQVASYFAARGN